MRPDDEIFSDALDLPPDQRAAFLDEACAADPAQRARVAALLASEAAARTFLDTPPVDRPIFLPEEKPGDIIDRYTLVRRIGDGGCGVVYLAEQTSPVRRHVALKVIKLGMDTREVIARFEAERQALALMDHPDIARVFDAGSTASGRPYFVMEFVDGAPITRFCDEQCLDTSARLELFARVCTALQHAHQKGIIHRDVKPSNILVTMQDGVPAPKIIDFGIAKATRGRLAEHTLVTALDQIIGTPAYMSPEQVEAREFDIDTRSDVYALGVLLYELLAGRPPYDPQSLVRAGLAEIRRIIREVDPPRPSTRLATLTAADRDTVARLRGAGPVQLSLLLRGDLDWVVMRCLEKDRARRYGTAQELADDVRRHLRREPVTARPPDAIYRARKFVSRHRLACAATAAVALALVLGTVVSLVQASRARRAETVARAERDAAEVARAAEALARTDAQRRQEQAEELLGFMLGDFRTELKKIGKLSLLDAVGDKALAHFSALDPRDLTDTALTRHAKTLTQIGEIRLDQARYADATRAFETALVRASTLAARHPRDADILFERAQAEFWLGFTARRRGEIDSARDWLIRYRESALALIQLEGSTPRALREASSGAHNLAVLEYDAGRAESALAAFRQVGELRRQLLAATPGDVALRGQLADNASWLGRAAELAGDLAGALSYHEESQAGFRSLQEAEPRVPRWSARVADSLVFGAQILAITGRTGEAARRLAEARGIYEQVTRGDAKNVHWQRSAAGVGLHEAELAAALGKTDRARTLLAEVRPQFESLVAAEPTSLVFRRTLARALRLEAELQLAADPRAALATAERAAALSVQLLAETPDDRLCLRELGQAGLCAGRSATALADRPAATRHWRAVVERLTPAATRTPRDWSLLAPLAQAHVLLSDRSAARPLVAELQRIGYRAPDPLSAATLAANP